MQDGILFDNIVIADDEKVASSILEKTWKPKFDVEKEKQKAEQAAAGSSDGLSEFQVIQSSDIFQAIMLDTPSVGNHVCWPGAIFLAYIQLVSFIQHLNVSLLACYVISLTDLVLHTAEEGLRCSVQNRRHSVLGTLQDQDHCRDSRTLLISCVETVW
jgi:hypothetical protein